MAVIANFTINVTSGNPPTAPFSVSLTDTSTGSPNKWLWDFGDGKTSDEQNPSHTYTVTGSYTITLKAFVQTGFVNRSSAFVSGRYKVGSGKVTNAEAYADWQSKSWSAMARDLSAAWYNENISSFIRYTAYEITYDYDLSAYTSGVAELRTLFTVPFTAEGNTKTDSGFSSSTVAGGTYWLIEDVTSSLGGVHRTTWTDANNNVSIQDPAGGTPRGYKIYESVVKIWTSTDIDTISKEIIPLACDFVGSPVSGRNNTEVQFTDLSDAGITAWSWRRRKAGTDDAFVEFATTQNPAKKFDKWDP